MKKFNFRFAVKFLYLILIIFWNWSLTSQNIQTHKGNFKDEFGRTVYFRGINIAGSSKVPFSHNCKTKTNLCNDVSFVGRPFSIEDADTHFDRLQKWGFNFVRLIVTWEALEPKRPKQYDWKYISYLKSIIDIANNYGIYVLIDPHQDVWSRFTGGDGAPLWTLEKIGFNVGHFQETNAALVFQEDEDIPPMIWPTNYTKLASSTMFTLFFGGNDFAKKTKIDNINVQDHLQQHYLDAFSILAKSLKESPNVIGFEVMNEPHPGWIGQDSLSNYMKFPLRNMATPTPSEAIALGAGYTSAVANWEVGLVGLKEIGKITINDEGKSAWKHDSLDVWHNNNVWKASREGEFKISNEAYFDRINGKSVNFTQDYYVPFIYKFTEAIRREKPDALIFVEKPFESLMPVIDDLDNLVNATHWYDQITLIKKQYLSWATLDLSNGSVVLGKKKIDTLFKSQIKYIKNLSIKLGVNAPTLVGEFGIPFDLSKGASYSKNLFGNWDFRDQTLALDRSIKAIENNAVSYALWNYTPDNTNTKGDMWNGEDLSIYSLSQKEANSNGINNGGRALRAAIRPFASAVTGNIVSSSFNMQTGTYHLTFDSSKFTGDKTVPTILHLPEYYYKNGFKTEVSDGKLLPSNDASVWHYIKTNDYNLHDLKITSNKSLKTIRTSKIWLIILAGIVFVLVFLKRKYRTHRRTS
jgi:aryl-phospho-beta-D-glucosidase BglC (GH1 family)